MADVVVTGAVGAEPLTSLASWKEALRALRKGDDTQVDALYPRVLKTIEWYYNHILVTVALLTVTVAVGHALYFRDTVDIHVLKLSRIVGVREILHCDDRAALKTAVFVLALEDAHLAHAAALIAGANFRGVTQAHDLADPTHIELREVVLQYEQHMIHHAMRNIL
eukprot:COSAG06_NODE_18846_length_865_cov_6.120104_1_plen_165_part_10